MLKEEKYQEIFALIDEVEDLRSEVAWAYAFERPESVRKNLVSDCIDARSKLIDLILNLTPDDFEIKRR